MRAHSRHRDKDGKGKRMKKVGMRRGVRALVLVGSIVGLLTVGLATQATATSKQANPNSSIGQDLGATFPAGSTMFVAVATGTFAGPVGCHDNVGNTYMVVADQNTGSGRLFVCSSALDFTLSAGDVVTATYPSFSGLSVMSLLPASLSLTSDAQNTGSGSNPPVSSGTINVGGNHLLLGVVANSNISTFVQDAPWTFFVSNSGGSGAGKRTISFFYRFVSGAADNYAVTGHLTGSGFWQAAIIGNSYPPV
jgi:hypothetical protein